MTTKLTLVSDDTMELKRPPHHWVTSTLGHGTMMCSNCKITMDEAAAIGCANECDAGGET